MHPLSIALFALSANLDSLAVGFSYGLQGIVIDRKGNFLAGIIPFAGALLALFFGRGVLQVMPERAAQLAGGGLIVLIGLWGIGELVRKKAGRAQYAKGAFLTTRQALVLGAALAANNMALGAGAGITGVAPLPAALASLLCGLLFLYVGNRLGRLCTGGKLVAGAQAGAALLMVALGIYEMFV